MSDANDTRAANSELSAKEQASLSSVQDLIRNFLDRVAMDGSKDINALQYLQGIAANTAAPPMPQSIQVYHGNDAVTGTVLIKGRPNSCIVIIDIFLSLEDVVNIDLVDSAGNYLWATMYAPNPGQGFSQHFPKGLWLPAGEALAHNSSQAVNYSIGINYARVER